MLDELEKLEEMEASGDSKYAVSGCEGCIYLTRVGCEYILMTGHKRPCPPGNQCTEKKVPGSDSAAAQARAEKVRTASRALWVGAKSWDQQKARELAKQGKNDAEIAEECGVSYQTIYGWRRRNGIEGKCAPARIRKGKPTVSQGVTPASSVEAENAVAEAEKLQKEQPVHGLESEEKVNFEEKTVAAEVEGRKLSPTFLGNIEMSVETEAFKAKVWALSMEDAQVAVGMMEKFFRE